MRNEGCAGMVGKIDRMKRLRLFGDFLMLGSFLMLLWVFLSAYLDGDFSTMVHINNYGEAHVEMIILVFILLPLALLTTALSFIDWRQTWKTKHRILQQKYTLKASVEHYPELFAGTLACPRCGVNFFVENLYTGALTTCPKCGMLGRYVPGNERYDYNDDGPNVKVIKDIWR